MSREIKKGLDYFPLDVDILLDPKVEYLEALHGNIGFSLYIKILCKIYQNGYYLKWSEKDAIIFSKRNNFDINVTIKVLNDCINDGLFCKNLYDNYSILTSDAIQKRYFKAVERRKKIDIISKYTIIDVNVYINPENVNIIDLNDNKSTQSRVEYSRVKKSKVKKTKIKTSLPENFSISENVRKWAKEKGHTDLQEHLENFKLQCEAKGYTYKNWDSAFMKAIAGDWAKLNNKQNASRIFQKKESDINRIIREETEKERLANCHAIDTDFMEAE